MLEGGKSVSLRQMAMKTNSSLSVTATLNAEDLMQLVEEGELQENGVVIGTTDPERKRFQEMVNDD
jgi:hypothetical protein